MDRPQNAHPGELELSRLEGRSECGVAGENMRKPSREAAVQLCRIAICSALLCAAAVCASAQSSAYEGAKNEWGAWGAFSFANGHVFGFAQDRSVQRFSLRYGRLLWHDFGMSLRYQAEAVPALIVGEPRFPLLTGHAAPGSPVDHVYGAGLSPVGAKMNFLTRRRVQPFLTSDGGFVYFSRKLLAAQTTQFNFTIHVSAGAELFVTPRRALEFGYMFHHFSNANLGNRNPGLDAHMLFVGVAFR